MRAPREKHEKPRGLCSLHRPRGFLFERYVESLRPGCCDVAVLARSPSAEDLGGQLRATLATTCRNNCATGTGAHACTEPVHLCATTVIWLERTLTHEKLRDVCARRHRKVDYELLHAMQLPTQEIQFTRLPGFESKRSHETKNYLSSVPFFL